MNIFVGSKKCNNKFFKFFALVLLISWVPVFYAASTRNGFWNNTNVRVFVTPFMVFQFVTLLALVKVNARLLRFFLGSLFLLLSLYFLLFPFLQYGIYNLICGY